MTAVMRRAEAVLQAEMMIKSSIIPSLISPGAVVWRTKTGIVVRVMASRREIKLF